MGPVLVVGHDTAPASQTIGALLEPDVAGGVEDRSSHE
jgi:hypothetical protein